MAFNGETSLKLSSLAFGAAIVLVGCGDSKEKKAAKAGNLIEKGFAGLK
jgi:hypothetical protein